MQQTVKDYANTASPDHAPSSAASLEVFSAFTPIRLSEADEGPATKSSFS